MNIWTNQHKLVHQIIMTRKLKYLRHSNTIGYLTSTWKHNYMISMWKDYGVTHDDNLSMWDVPEVE